MPHQTLQFESEMKRLLGEETTTTRWNKLYTTGWDIWPCQYTDFHTPDSDSVDAEKWMDHWPNHPNTYRMDLYWKNSPTSKLEFHMCNEMYINETWLFPDSYNSRDDESRLSTLKTKAVMWGTEAHENWYLLHSDLDLKLLVIYYCAYTDAVQRFDSMTMVLQRDDGPTLTTKQEEEIESIVLSALGEHHSKLQRIESCT
jgi:hypothetical protein